MMFAETNNYSNRPCALSCDLRLPEKKERKKTVTLYNNCTLLIIS